jgi:hypothetical protein
MSDGARKYEWKGLPAGRYRLWATLPNYIKIALRDRDLDLPGNGCLELNLYLQPNGQITGRVYTAEGRPVPNQDRDLAAAPRGFKSLRTHQLFMRLTPGNSEPDGPAPAPWDWNHPFVTFHLKGTPAILSSFCSRSD